MAFVLSFYKITDEKLLPCKARFRIIQYIPNKLDKLGIKLLLMAVDSETKYSLKSFSYLGKMTYTVKKLMQPIFKRGYNVTCDYFVTSFDIAFHLVEQKFCIVDTIRQSLEKYRKL